MDSCGETGSFQDRPSIILIAGFGDSAEMFERLMETSLAAVFRLVPIDLPGFGGTRPLKGSTTLAALAEFAYARVKAEEARIIVAHSAGSIVASLVAERAESQIDTILSLEGNITAEDAYYSGSAADYSNPFEFKGAFLARLEELSRTNPVYERYRSIVGRSDAKALWELGCDVRRFSNAQAPGDLLSRCASVYYFYNPSNCPKTTVGWLRESSVNLVETRASHWMSVDQPNELARLMLALLKTPSGDGGLRAREL